MRIWGQLEKACLEILGADPTQGVQGRVWFNSVSNEMKVDDGTTVQTIQYSQRGNGPVPDWVSAANAPLESIDAQLNKIYLFSTTALQGFTTTVKVPSGYVSGRQITLLLDVYSTDNANKFLAASLATLIRPGTDAFTSTANQHASTTLSTSLVGKANIPQLVTLDITDASGMINGVAVQPNHIIQIYLFRQNSAAAPQSEVFTDTATDLAVYAPMEVVF